MTVARNLILYIFMLGVIISLHELGHLLETEYCLRLIPMGGFVAMAGDTDNDLETKVDIENLPPERTLTGIAKWKRVIIMMAGIMMNILLAIFIYSMIILRGGQYATSTKPVIVTVQEASPALRAGLKEGDIVNKVEFENGLSYAPDTYLELINFLDVYDGKGPWIMTVERNGESIRLDVTPEFNEEQQRYMIGIGFSNQAVEVVKVNLLNCWKYGFEYAMFILKLTFSSFLSLFKGKNLDSLSGPIGIYSTVSQTASLGMDYYIQLIAMVSINVGIVNALPLPIFDGGRVVLLLIEMIIGHPLSEKAQNAVMSASLGLLLLLFMFVMYNDISKLIGG